MTILRTRTGPALLLSAALGLSAGCDLAMVDFKEQRSERWSRTYEIAPGGRFELRNVNGRITLQTGEGRVIEVTAEKRARAATPEMAEQALGRVRIEEDASPDAVRVTTRTDSSDGFFNRAGSISLEYTVRVPPDIAVDLTNTNGGIELTGVRGPAKVSTTNGGIKALNVGGALEARTTNGGLEIDLVAVADPGVRLSCTNGGITVRLPADARASIEARITNGGISTGGLRLDTLESSRRSLEAQLNGGGPRIEIRGTNGGVKLEAR